MAGVRIAVQCALRVETLPLRRLLPPLRRLEPWPGTAWEGELAGNPLLVAVSGMGPQAAARHAEHLCARWQPELLVLAGVAGALDPALPVGAVVSATLVCSEDTVLIPGSTLAAPHRGVLLSAPRVLVTATAKREARGAAGEGPLAVEMETGPAARVADRHGVSWAAMRAISDGADEDLPLDFERLRGADGQLAPARLVGALLRRPGALPGLHRLGRNTGAAARALATQLVLALAGEVSRPGRGR
jgi:adenosylhomocysteine nucleosidase